MLQKQGCIGSLAVVDRICRERTAIIAKKNARETSPASAAAVTSITAASIELLSPGSASANEESEYDSDINVKCANKCMCPRTILPANVSSTPDRTNASIGKSAMIMASVLNESGTEFILLPLKSTIHHQHQLNRIEVAEDIKLPNMPDMSPC